MTRVWKYASSFFVERKKKYNMLFEKNGWVGKSVEEEAANNFVHKPRIYFLYYSFCFIILD